VARAGTCRQGRVEPANLVGRQTRAPRDIRQLQRARHAHRVDLFLPRRRGELADGRQVAEDHLGVVIGPRAVSPVQIAIAIQIDLPEIAGHLRAHEVLLPDVAAAQPLTIDQRAAHVDAATVVVREGGDERAVLRRKNRQIRGAVRRLRGLVTSLEDGG
jgi:hypothetical protein